MTGLPALNWLADNAAERERAGLRRRLRPRTTGETLVDFAGNDYLGLARDPRVVAAAADAAREWGAGSTGSRLVTGSTALHTELENTLAEFVGAAGGLVFSSGYLANVGAVTALSGPGSLLVSDALNHASIVDACRLSRARVVVTPHRDVGAVEKALAGRAEDRAVVVTDAVFSVDGDIAPLPELAEAVRRHDALLVVDEAHSLGVVGDGGRGAVFASGLAYRADVVRTLTLSKSLGSQGGAVVGDVAVIAHLVDSARSFIFDTGLAPACVGAALASVRILSAEPERAARVRDNARHIAAIGIQAGFRATQPSGAVVALPMTSPQRAVDAAAECAARGIRVGCFRPPSVPDGVSRLRLTARADLTTDDFAALEKALEFVAP